MRSFDPGRVGELECDAWVSYYRRRWVTFLRAAFGLTRESFGLSWPGTLRGGWWVLRANQVHREPGEDGELVEALEALYSHVYSVPRENVRLAAEQRVLAMVHSDRWVAEGCDPQSPLITEERAALVRSYEALRGAVS